MYLSHTRSQLFPFMNNRLCASLSFRIQIFLTSLHVYLKGFGDVRIALPYLEWAYARITAVVSCAGPGEFWQIFHFCHGEPAEIGKTQPVWSIPVLQR